MYIYSTKQINTLFLMNQVTTYLLCKNMFSYRLMNRVLCSNLPKHVWMVALRSFLIRKFHKITIYDDDDCHFLCRFARLIKINVDKILSRLKISPDAIRLAAVREIGVSRTITALLFWGVLWRALLCAETLNYGDDSLLRTGNYNHKSFPIVRCFDFPKI